MSDDDLKPGHSGAGDLFDRATLDRVEEHLAPTDALLASAYPGPGDSRQPVHTVYVPADAIGPGTAAGWGATARDLAAQDGGVEALCHELGLDPGLAAEVAPRVEQKLLEEPVEDLRVDFEDGYGVRPDEVEDAAVAAALAARRADEQDGTATPFWGIRFKCFESDVRARGLRTLGRFLSGLADGDGAGLPEGLRLTFPKVSTASQVEALVLVLEEAERKLGLDSGRLTFEIQVETPPLILGVDGRAELAAAVRAGGARVSGLHYGTYDYSASMQVAAAHQAMDHPVADQAKAVMQLVAAGTPVELSDGSTNVVPSGDAAQRRAARELHHRLVTRSLRQGIYQGWDMHPGHLITRYIANYAFFRSGLPSAGDRIGRYIAQVQGEVMDEPATVRALARYLHRGHSCGAIGEDELVSRTGLDGPRMQELARPRSDTAALAKEAHP